MRRGDAKRRRAARQSQPAPKPEARGPRPRAFPAKRRTSSISESEAFADQWNEMRLGGQYVAKTLPIRFFRGTRPQTRESQDDFRLSPIMRYMSFGMRVYVFRGGMSDNPIVRSSRRSGLMYGSSSFRPLT